MAPLSSTIPARICVLPMSIPRTTMIPFASRAGDAPAAVYGDDLAGDRPRVIAEQEERGAGDIFGVHHAVGQRLLLTNEIEQLGIAGALAGGRGHPARR